MAKAWVVILSVSGHSVSCIAKITMYFSYAAAVPEVCLIKKNMSSLRMHTIQQSTNVMTTLVSKALCLMS